MCHANSRRAAWTAAEEVLSETFLAAWRNRERVEPEGGSLRPWLFGIATHKALRVRRGRRRERAFLAPRSVPEPVAEAAVRRGAGGRTTDAGSGRVPGGRRPGGEPTHAHRRTPPPSTVRSPASRACERCRTSWTPPDAMASASR
ncbi:sigma-70 family RNA polymerase sigma factor [Streptomyces oceani]|uniref:RNA polymerase sigma factor n=1 Tax=Streptomyces oceani TaxID=1075402 RepID=UPI0009A0A501